MCLPFTFVWVGHDFSCASALLANSAVSICPTAFANWTLLIHGHTSMIPLGDTGCILCRCPEAISVLMLPNDASRGNLGPLSFGVGSFQPAAVCRLHSLFPG